MENELQHWGIKGMKWGIRRFQNKDGTLTAAGKKRRENDSWSDEELEKKGREIHGDEELGDIARSIQSASGLRAHNEQKTRREKLTAEEGESELKKLHDEYDNWYSEDRERFHREIYDHIGSYRDSTPVSKKYESAMYKLMAAKDLNLDGKLSDSIVRKYEDGLCNTVLSELGYKVTDSSREYIYPYVFQLSEKDDIRHFTLGETFVAECISTSTNELYHHGIKGMKWGVRRFQKKDGTLTKLGKRRAAKEGDSDDKPKTKKVSDMSDAELKAAISRLENEKRYRELKPEKVSLGKQFLEKAIIPALMEGGKKVLTEFATKAGKKALGLDIEVDDDGFSKLKKQVDKLEYKKKLERLTRDTTLEDMASKTKIEAEYIKNKKIVDEYRAEMKNQGNKDAKTDETPVTNKTSAQRRYTVKRSTIDKMRRTNTYSDQNRNDGERFVAGYIDGRPVSGYLYSGSKKKKRKKKH